MRKKDLKKDNFIIRFCKNWYYGTSFSKEAWIVYLATPIITYLVTKLIFC